MSTLSLIPEERRYLPNISKSTESLYSSSSSKYSASALYRRKLTGLRQPGFIPVQNEVRQRVLSARRLRVKTLQNQLTDAQQNIAEMANENRILRTLHKRQDTALSKYEGTNAELPQLLHSHAEEVRMWEVKCRNMTRQNKELARKLKERDSMLLALGDQNKHLTQLNKDKNLEDRERLSERVRFLENRLKEKDNDLKLLARRLQLEAKNFKSQLYKEQQKYKQLIHRLEQAKIDTDKLSLSVSSQLDLKDRTGHLKTMMPRSISSSKIPKSNKMFERNGMGRDSDSNHSKAGLSTPALSEEITSRNRPGSKSAKQLNGYHSPEVRTDFPAQNISRQNSGSQKNRRVPNGDHLSNAIVEGMSRLLCSDAAGEHEASLNGNGVPSEQENLLDQSEPDNYFDYDGNYENGDDYYDSEDDNDNSAEITPAEKPSNAYTPDAVVQQTRHDIAKIQRQMADDYQQRESFLDTFCRESITDDKDASARRSKHIDSKRKEQLLAALKAIDTAGE